MKNLVRKIIYINNTDNNSNKKFIGFYLRKFLSEIFLNPLPQVKEVTGLPFFYFKDCNVV